MNQQDRARRTLMLAGIAGLAAQLESLGVAAQDPAKVMPKSYRVAREVGTEGKLGG